MEPVGPAELLALWERGAADAPGGRALSVLTAAGFDQPGHLTLGQRDRALLRCQQRWFGPTMAATTDCPACAEPLELELDAGDLAGAVPEPSPERDIEADGYSLQVRAPTAGDLASRPSGASDLLARCVVGASREGTAISATELPPAVVEAAEAAMAAMDPGAELDIELTCPACRHIWTAYLEPVAFVWAGLDRSVRRLSGEVHLLASAYGWREDDILGLSPWRRQLYLDEVGRP